MIGALLILLGSADAESNMKTQDPKKQEGMLDRFFRLFPGMPYIAWYPEAGTDFKSLVNLSPEFWRRNQLKAPALIYPDLYILSNSSILNLYSLELNAGQTVYSDEKLSMRIDRIEQIQQINFGKRGALKNIEVIESTEISCAYFMVIEVKAKKQDDFAYLIPVLYLNEKPEVVNDLFFKKAELSCSHLIINQSNKHLPFFNKDFAFLNDNILHSALTSLKTQVLFTEESFDETLLPEKVNPSVFKVHTITKSIVKQKSTGLGSKKPKAPKDLKRKVKLLSTRNWPSYTKSKIIYYS